MRECNALAKVASPYSVNHKATMQLLLWSCSIIDGCPKESLQPLSDANNSSLWSALVQQQIYLLNAITFGQDNNNNSVATTGKWKKVAFVRFRRTIHKHRAEEAYLRTVLDMTASADQAALLNEITTSISVSPTNDKKNIKETDNNNDNKNLLSTYKGRLAVWYSQVVLGGSAGLQSRGISLHSLIGSFGEEEVEKNNITGTFKSSKTKP